MKKNYILLLIILLISALLTAQNWTFHSDFPINTSPLKGDFDNSGNLYMLSNNNEVWKLDINDWSKFPDYPVGNFLDMTINKNTGTVYLADAMQGLVYTSNNGTTWQNAFIDTNPNSGFHEFVNTLSNISNSNIFYGGGIRATFPFHPAMFKYTSNGSVITNIELVQYGGSTNQNNRVECIFQSMDGSKIIVGTVGNGFWISQDFGLNFQNTFPNYNIYKVTSGPNNSFLALGTNLTTNENEILKSLDGLNWTIYHTFTNMVENLTEIYYDGVNSEIWIGSNSNIYKIINLNDPTPILQPFNLNNSQQYVRSIVKSNNTVSLFSQEYIFQQYNINWIQNINGLVGNTSHAIFDSNNNLYAIDLMSSIISKKSVSMGQWLNFAIPGTNQIGLSNLVSDNNGNVYFTKLNNLYKIDSSNNLTNINLPNVSANFITLLVASGAGQLFIIFNNETNKIYSSINQGFTWNLFLDASASSDTFENILVDDSNNIFFNYHNNNAQFYYSTDNANTWNIFTYDNMNDPSCFGFDPVFFNNSNGKIFLGVCNKIFLVQFTNNNIELELIPLPNDSILDKILVAGNSFYAVSSDFNVYKSDNLGQTWMNYGRPNQLAPYPTSMFHLLSNTNLDVLALTYSTFNLPASLRGFYKLNETLSTQKPDLFPVIIYPNPANDILNINTHFTVDKISLIDITGKWIDLYLNNYNQIEVGHLKPGVYILKITTKNGQINISKFIKK